MSSTGQATAPVVTDTMPERSPLHQEIDSLPGLVEDMIDLLVGSVAELLPRDRCRTLDRVYLTGCGDSHHAGVSAEMAFGLLGGLPCRAATALHFGRYVAPFLPNGETALVMAVSVSGRVSRTVEALTLARQTGALTVAITGSQQAPLAKAGELLLATTVPPLPQKQGGLTVPGARSYVASLLALLITAVHLGEMRGHLSKKEATNFRRELALTASLMEQTIAASDDIARQAALSWADAQSAVYCGGGPNQGTALFSAAKLLEATGETAVAQDLEEWAHLEYFGREARTPTFLISAGQWDADRALEVATAARAIGRPLALVVPARSAIAGQRAETDFLFALAEPLAEWYSPLVACLPGLLYAAYRAQLSGEPYFRAFGDGRSAAGGGGISRIRTSAQIDRLPGNIERSSLA